MTEFKKEAATGRFFFRKENRVLLRADFLLVYDKGQRWRKPMMHVFVMSPLPVEVAGDNTKPTPTRLGITATKKMGNAVKRNRARRLVRESFRHTLPELKPGHSIVVNVLRNMIDASAPQVDEQLRGVLRQAGVFTQRDD